MNETTDTLATALSPTSRTATPSLVPAATWVAAVSSLAACGGGGAAGESAATPPAASGPSEAAATLPGANGNSKILAEQVEQAEAAANGARVTELPREMSEGAAVRFLNQATFGSNEASIARARALWRSGWLEEQFNMTPSRSHWDGVQADGAAWLSSRPVGSDDTIPPQNVIDRTLWQSYLTAPDQLRKRVGYALSQIFVIDVPTLLGSNYQKALGAAGFLDILESCAFGNFRELLERVTLSPAMGTYLTYQGNLKAEYPGGDTTQPPLRGPDENYAREVMQLFTIGLVQLNSDGTPRLGSNGQPIETYTQEDVLGLARVFTGWRNHRGTSETEWARTPMRHIAQEHSPEVKQFLGTTIPAGTDGPTSLRIALDVLFNHPNVGPFIGRQLIQRLVTSNPSPAYVGRVAAAFANNGNGVRGDMKAVVEAVLRDIEARSLAKSTQPSNQVGKLLEPVLRFTTFARCFNVSFAGEYWPLTATESPSTELGQSPMRAPSVFNFYRPGYVPPNSGIARAGLVAPEFQISTDTSLPGYVNFMRLQLSNISGGLVYDFTAELALAGDPAALAERLNKRLLAGAMSADTRGVIVNTITALPGGTETQTLNRVRTAILLALVAPEFIVQK